MRNMKNHFNKLIFLTILFNFFFLPNLFGQGKNIKFESISVDQGLSQSSGRVVFQDKKGFMWFGTQDGLNRYDGYNLKLFENDPLDENSLTDNFILSCYEEKSGIIWVGTNGGGLNRFDPDKEEFIRFKNEPYKPGSLSNDFVNCIYKDKFGTLWIGTNYGLNKLVLNESEGFDGEQKTFEFFIIDSANVMLNGISSIFEDSKGDLWVGTLGSGLSKFDRNLNKFKQILYQSGNPTSLSSNIITSVFEDSKENFWIGTAGGGVNKFDREKEIFTRYKNNPNNPESLSHNNVFTLFEDNSGNLWVGTQGGGLNVYDKTIDGFIHYQNDPGDPTTLNNNFVFSICQDRSGTIWIGTGGGGINKYDPQKNKFLHYKIDPLKTNNTLDNFIWSVFEDRSAIIWIGTQGGGLYKFEREKEEYTHYLNNPSDPYSLSNDVVLAILEDKKGNLWIGTQGGGLNKLNRKTGRFKRYQTDATPVGLTNNFIRTIFEDNQGFIWLGSSGGGLIRFDPEQENFIPYLYSPNNQNGISGNDIVPIFEDRFGILWVGTIGSGLNRFDKNEQQFLHFLNNPYDNNSLSHNRVRAIYGGNNGTLWVGTDKGLNKLVVPEKEKFNRTAGKFKTYTKNDGLPNDVIYGILSDNHGNLWISTNKGLSKFNPETEVFKNYDVDDGLQSNEFNTGAFCLLKSGEMLFGGINGFNIFHPDSVKDNPYMPPIVLTSFKKSGKDAKLDKVISATEQIKLSYKDHSFSFEFAALDFTNPLKNRYAYQLEGVDEDWIYCGYRKVAAYTRIDPGQYVFKVKGSNNDGVWNEGGTAVKILILPPFFWATWWFRIIAVLCLHVLGYSLYRKRMKNVSLRTELRAAHDAQMSIMPQSDPKTEGFDISGVCIPANEVGGDFYDYFWMDKNKTKFGIAVGDVSGKAMKSAMTAIMTNGMVYLKANEIFSAAEIMTQVNRSVFSKTDKKTFVAFCLVSIDIATKELTFVNAGLHEPLIKSGGSVKILAGFDPKYPLGSVVETVYQEKTIKLKSGDTLVLYTDGIIDAQNRVKEFYGFDALRNCVNEIDTTVLTAVKIKEKIINAVHKFSGGSPQYDDMTVVVIKC